MSCGRNSRHIDVRYFFAKDRVDTEGIDIVYCPTEQMLADFFTKPLQGSLFRRFKAVFIGNAHISTLLESPSATTKEVLEVKISDKLLSDQMGLMRMEFPQPPNKRKTLDHTQQLCVEPRDM